MDCCAEKGVTHRKLGCYRPKPLKRNEDFGYLTDLSHLTPESNAKKRKMWKDPPLLQECGISIFFWILLRVIISFYRYINSK
jgi:hypothetical protein